MELTRRLSALALVAIAGALRAAGPPVQAEVVAIESLTHDVKRVRVKLPAGYSFQAGQFALVRVPEPFVEEWNAKYGAKHGEVRRPYSFASSPSRLPIAEFIVKLAAAPPGKDVPPGLCSTWIHRYLKAGDRIEIGTALGSLAVAADARRPIVLVAGSSGIAPFVGLLEHWFETRLNQRRSIYLFAGARQRRDLILHDRMRTWARDHQNFHYIPALSHPSAEDDWKGETGFINAVLDRHFPGVLDADVILAGSPVMMQETRKVLKSKQVPEDQIRHDPIHVQ